MSSKNKKPTSAPKQRPQRNEAAESKRLQRETLGLLRNELKELHQLSLLVLAEQGILPPLYGGDYLGEDKAEIIPLWATLDPKEGEAEGLEVLAMMVLRLMPGAEPNADLRAERNEIGLENFLPIAEFVETIEKESGETMPFTDEQKQGDMLFPLAGPQLRPVGMNYLEMSDHISEGLPFAVLVKIPTNGTGDEFSYDWDNIENYQADVICEDSPQMLEAAVWNYRLEEALQLNYEIAQSEGKDPDETLPATSVTDLVGIYDAGIRGGIRFYGSTSPLPEKQQELDILREEDGTLLIKTPLKVGVEPIKPLAEARQTINQEEAPGTTLLRIDGTNELMQKTWADLRAYNFFCIRACHGKLSFNKHGQPVLEGYDENPQIQWLMSDSMDELYRLIHLIVLYEFLSLVGMVKGKLLMQVVE